MRPRGLRHSIGMKIFAAFLAMAVLIGALGFYGYSVLSHAGDMVAGGPAIAIHHARAAGVSLMRMRQIANFKFSLVWFTAATLLLAMLMSAALARRIARPFAAAMAAADRIAGGELETRIPRAVQDQNIRTLTERDQAWAGSAETRLARALEASREGVLLVGPDGRVLLANKSVKDFFPSVAHDLIGMDFGEASLLAQEDILGDETLPTPQDLGLGRRARSLGHTERQLKDGRWIRSEGTRTSDGGFVFFISDFTAIKNREEDAHRAQKAAEAASAAKSRFLTNMSHELRPPLDAIIGFSEIVSGQLFGPLGDPRYGEYATDIHRSARHLLDVVNSALDISRGEAGRQNLNAETLDLRHLLRDCGRTFAEQCDAAQLTFALDDLHEPAMVYGEKAKLRRAFLNLLSNALKFTQSGGAVRVMIEAREDQVQVTVADTGAGMTADEIQIALTPFGQVDSTVERKLRGAGLGLPLARSLVELHGGTLKVESDKTSGTKVRVRLPRVPAVEVRPPVAAVS